MEVSQIITLFVYVESYISYQYQSSHVVYLSVVSRRQRSPSSSSSCRTYCPVSSSTSTASHSSVWTDYWRTSTGTSRWGGRGRGVGEREREIEGERVRERGTEGDR